MQKWITYYEEMTVYCAILLWIYSNFTWQPQQWP